jgi:ankyrin repeat protein
MKLDKLPPELIEKIIIYTDLRTAIISKNLHCILYIYKPHIHTWKWACLNNQLEVVKWLYENEISGRDHYAIDLAAKNGHLDIVKYLHTHKSKIVYTPHHYDNYNFSYYKKFIEPQLTEIINGCSVNAMDWAAQNGHLDVIKYLYSIGKKCSIVTLLLAKENEHLDVDNFLESVLK